MCAIFLALCVCIAAGGRAAAAPFAPQSHDILTIAPTDCKAAVAEWATRGDLRMMQSTVLACAPEPVEAPGAELLLVRPWARNRES